MLVNIALVSQGSPEARTTRTASATASHRVVDRRSGCSERGHTEGQEHAPYHPSVSIPAHVSLPGGTTGEAERQLGTAGAEPGWAGALAATLPDVVVIVGADGLILHRNQVAENLFGPLAPVGGHARLLAGAAVDAARLTSDIRTTLGQGLTYRGIASIRDRSGRTAPYTIIVRRDPAGVLVAVARDTIAARERELLERERDATGDFVRRLGHELRTPLNAVLGFAQLLELELLSAEQRADVERILTGGRHMQALLDEVLDLSRVRSGHVDLDVASVPVAEVVRSVVDLTTGLADARSMRVHIAPGEDLVARADRRRLTQVLLNLVDNAVKYGREGGTIRVALSPGSTRGPAGTARTAGTAPPSRRSASRSATTGRGCPRTRCRSCSGPSSGWARTPVGWRAPASAWCSPARW